MPQIFITGGAGFLGRHILREARSRHPDWRFTVYSRDEAKHAKARAEFPDAHFILGDITDLKPLALAMAGHDMVIHAAALKYVPQAEDRVAYAIKVNIHGSRNVELAATHTGVARVVGISTDKACRPTSVYGMTKRLMERSFQEADTLTTKTQFNCVRYGNVIGSTGSVIPIFQDQVRKGAPLTVTDPGMTRFWLSAAEAVDLIFGALDLERKYGGVTLVPRIAATDMRTVAHAAARAMNAPEPEIEVTGKRPGEKHDEDLLAPEEVPWTFRGRQRLMLLLPPTVPSLPSAERVDGLYTSATPDHWLKVDELAGMIRDAVEHD